MKEHKIRMLVELCEDQLYNRLQYMPQKYNMGFNEKKATIRYNDVPFEVHEISGANVMTGEYMNRIFIEVPRNIMKEGGIQVALIAGNTRTEAVDLRKRACHELARQFVTEVLPKVDFELEKEVYERNIDRILSVLD